MSTTTAEPITTTPTSDTEEGDHERCAHIVYPKELVTRAYITGEPVEALCGKLWTPNRDPEQFPVCQGCIDAFEKLLGRPWPGRR